VNIRHPELEEEYTDSIRELLQSQVLGFDVECPANESRPILVQLASRELCVLWRVNKQSPFPLRLHGVLSSPHFLKVGHGSLADARALLAFYSVNTVNLFDTHEFLTSLPDDLRPPLLNLQGLVGVFLGRWLSKTMTRSNWSRRRLSREQLLYASTDVWASLEVYLALMRYASDIEVMPPPSVECTLRTCRPELIHSLCIRGL
jgi:ribonuclease D